jgi:tyrosinase
VEVPVERAASAAKLKPEGTRQAQIHFNKCSHPNWWLLPWHRWYLFRFEMICRKLTGNANFALPYWNWAENPAVPGVFYASGDILNDRTKTLPQGTPISAEFVAHPVLEAILSEPNFQIFGSSAATSQLDRVRAGPLEATPHNNVHNIIGGDMATFMSPLDPIFWTHHSMLDYCWGRLGSSAQQPQPQRSGLGQPELYRFHG